MLDLVTWLWDAFGGIVNSKGYKVVNPKVRVLWGDGIGPEGVERILKTFVTNGWSVDNIACFGMGGALLQKVNRDTQRFAFKSSAQKRNGVWYDVFKEPRDKSKASKKGRLKLVKATSTHGDTVQTVPIDDLGEDLLVIVFENGNLMNFINFDQVRKNSDVKTIEELWG